MQLRNIKRIRHKATTFSLVFILEQVRYRKPKNTVTAPQETFGIASAALIAGLVKLAKLPVMLFNAFNTPSKSLLPPIFIENVLGNELPDACVFCSAKNAGSKKNSVKPSAISENKPVFTRFRKKFQKPCQ